MRFDWNNASEKLLLTLLRSAYRDSPEQIGSLKTLSRARLAEQAGRVFGTPPRRVALDTCDGSWDVLRQVWLSKEAKLEQLAALAALVRRGLAVAERDSTARSRVQLLAFFGRRNLTDNFKINLRTAFIQAHKSKQPVRGTKDPRSPGEPEGMTRLIGRGARDLPVPWAHQLEARTQLESLALAARGKDRRGLLVLPTGAGKTSTAVGWLVPWLAADPARRVLWLAHQQELLIQAQVAFQRAAAEQGVKFDRQLRLITSGGSAASTLVDPELDVALVTWQTLHGQGAEQQVSRLNRFLSRPTVVVVDEAHHAAAAAYQRILNTVLKAEQVVLIGMTATPWPTSAGAGGRLRRTFPVDIYVATPEAMHRAGILATPILRTVSTGTRLELTSAERRLAGGDLPPAVMSRLATGARNDLLVRTWLAERSEWGKTLIFSSNKGHADTLGWTVPGLVDTWISCPN
jgi:Type III restriction enzyme, res subunit